MVQVKKVEVREAILSSAYRLFRSRGYIGTSMNDIGRAAGVAASNIYVYFDSKLAILYAVYEPWLTSRLFRLERELKHIKQPKSRLRLILRTLWVDIPAEDSHFANNLMQAISTATRDEVYSAELLLWCEDFISRMIRISLPRRRAGIADQCRLAHILFMAYDGFVMRNYLGAQSESVDEVIEMMIDLIMGKSPA